MSRRQTVALIIALAFGVFVGLFVRSYGGVGTPNGGIVVNIGPGYGLELWGDPGFFDCSDTGC